MLILLSVLVVTNMLTAAALLRMRLRRGAAGQARDSPSPESQAPDPQVLAALAAASRGQPAVGRSRRFISIEILNPIELAGARNRVFGIAGSFVPDLTRRVVYDQTLKILRTQLVEHQVVADVRVHTLRPAPDGSPAPYPDVVEVVIAPADPRQ
ncbi:MAG: hypothetical protein M3O28_09960 [Actinomycetota bacterium]|nr:hypothetical protein [Actinomycetota bacterium]